MWITHTFILRILVDQNDPKVLQGMLKKVASGEQSAFQDEQSLLAILHSLVVETKHAEDQIIEYPTG